MRQRTLSVVTFLLCVIGMGWTQTNATIQPDPQGMTTTDNVPASPEDARLIASPPVPSNEQQQFDQAVKDIHFDFDRADLRPEDRAILDSNAQWLKAHPDVIVTLEGDADERGDIVYNVVLSGERAEKAKAALVQMGVPANQIAFATGWGKLYPVCTQSDESCWSQNRRTHFALWPPEPEETQLAITLAP